MASEWREVSLKEAGVQLIDCDHRTPPAAEAGFPYIAIPQLKDGRIDLAGARRISANHFNDWTRKLRPRAYDVIVVRRCNSGQSAVVPEGLECAIGQNLVVLRAVEGAQVAPSYLRWLVRGSEWWSEVSTYLNVGAVFDSLKCKDIPNFRMSIPSFPEQKAIAEFLSAIDDRIDSLRQTNATLEAIAQALFKSWFVSFDPVRAKAEGREPEGMDAATAALFPSEFEGSELDPIPKGWRVRSLDSIAEYLNGLALQKYPPESEVEYLPVIKIAQLRAGHTNGADKASSQLKSEYIVEDGDILFSWSGSLEVEVWCGGRGALNQHLFKVTSSEVPKWFYYFATRHHLPGFRETAANKATTMGHIQRRHLTEARIAVPPQDLLKQLSAVIEPLFKERLNNALQAKSLASLRDTLLPRLISGKIRLSEAQAAFEDAVEA